MKLKRRTIRRGRIEIIPLIDTIVILLIFYMTFSRFAQAAVESGLELPTSRAGDDFKRLPNQLVVNMFNAQELIIDKQPIKIESFPAFIDAIKKRDPKYAKMSIILRGSRNMTYQDLSDFMKVCSKAKIADVTFTTLEKK
jgi:biopolymer transport protein ExbD